MTTRALQNGSSVGRLEKRPNVEVPRPVPSRPLRNRDVQKVDRGFVDFLKFQLKHMTNIFLKTTKPKFESVGRAAKDYQNVVLESVVRHNLMP